MTINDIDFVFVDDRFCHNGIFIVEEKTLIDHADDCDERLGGFVRCEGPVENPALLFGDDRFTGKGAELAAVVRFSACCAAFGDDARPPLLSSTFPQG